MATMNIKDPRVHELAHELAGLRGTSATAAVREALEEALRSERDHRVDRAAAARRLQVDFAAKSGLVVDVDELYGEDGLPR